MVCSYFEIESHFQAITGEYLALKTANREQGACSDLDANRVWVVAWFKKRTCTSMWEFSTPMPRLTWRLSSFLHQVTCPTSQQIFIGTLQKNYRRNITNIYWSRGVFWDVVWVSSFWEHAILCISGARYSRTNPVFSFTFWLLKPIYYPLIDLNLTKSYSMQLCLWVIIFYHCLNDLLTL